MGEGGASSLKSYVSVSCNKGSEEAFLKSDGWGQYHLRHLRKLDSVGSLHPSDLVESSCDISLKTV